MWTWQSGKVDLDLTFWQSEPGEMGNANFGKNTK
jgi:hypothetical protein